MRQRAANSTGAAAVGRCAKLLEKMLKSLRIQNLALIDDLTLEFGEGLNLLTGETGSGKSIVVDSIGLILGKRSTPEMIRTGAELARVEALLEVGTDVMSRLAESGIESDLNEPVIFRREIARSGKGRSWINQSPVTLGLLQALAPLLADIHGQQDQQLLQQPGLQLELLDAFAGCSRERAALRQAWEELSRLKRQLAASEMAEGARAQRLDFLDFQIREIEQADLKPEEEEQLLRERVLLVHGEELLQLSREVYEWLYDGDPSALSLLRRSARNLQRLAAIDEKLQGLQPASQTAQFALEELAQEVRAYSDRIDFDPARLQQVEDRLDKVTRLKKKFAASISSLFEALGQFKEERARLAAWDADRAKLSADCRKAEATYLAQAAHLSGKRLKAASGLQKAMEAELKSVAMERSGFVAALRPAEPSATGTDALEFLIAPNIGEEPKPLGKIASGGELSRLMLALKSVLHAGGEEFLVFDEVDSGIGGRVAETVGLKLKRLAGSQQVFCVTHLPQIAAFADVHYRIAKQVKKGRTLVEAEPLDSNGRLQEIARMLAGATVGQSALDHARELIARSSS